MRTIRRIAEVVFAAGRWTQRLTFMTAWALLLGAGTFPASAQLAVTEAQSWSTNCLCSATPWNESADWWELTNFGTNDIDLTDYKFCDRDKKFPQETSIWFFEGIVIRPGESIVFVRALKGTADAAEFRRCWGESNLPPALQIVFYDSGYGFDDYGDGVQFGDPEGNLLDYAEFGEATHGVTFTYDTNTGCLCELSQPGVRGAFQAACSLDIGSPGYAPSGPVRLQINQHPVSQVVTGGQTATFRVCATGLPKPRFQWFHDGVPIPGARNYCLALTNVQPEGAGQYHVELDNGSAHGLEHLVSAVATLTVDTNPAPAEILEAPHDLTAYPDSWQTAMFTVSVGGYPAPLCQWSKNGVDLAGETNRTLAVRCVDFSVAGTYCVRVENASGAAHACATLTVAPRPPLYITEVSSLACTNAGTPRGKDWWELTYLGTNCALNLRGYRWNDGSNVLGGCTIGLSEVTTGWCGCVPQVHRDWHDVVIRPGESIIFVESVSPEDFEAWWGTTNLPPGLQVIRYPANGLDDAGDVVRVWNTVGTEDLDYVCSVSFARARAGVSRWFAPIPYQAEWGVFSEPGQFGAFQAAQGCDVGSPGWYPWAPHFTGVRRDPAGVVLSWNTMPDSTYTLHCRTNVAAGVWTRIYTNVAAGTCMSFTNALLGTAPHCFYRVLCEPHFFTNRYEPTCAP